MTRLNAITKLAQDSGLETAFYAGLVYPHYLGNLNGNPVIMPDGDYKTLLKLDAIAGFIPVAHSRLHEDYTEGWIHANLNGEAVDLSGYQVVWQAGYIAVGTGERPEGAYPYMFRKVEPLFSWGDDHDA